jgi:Flp pilus assembly protein TadG
VSRRRDEQGSALVELSWLAIILLVPLIWIVISVFEVQQGAFATSAAARAAGRAYALAPDDATGAARADAVVRQVLADQGTPGQEAQVTVSCDAPGDNCHVGTAVITVRVESAVDLPFFPAIFDKGAASFALDATHTVPIGQYVESAPEDDEDPGWDPDEDPDEDGER